jgi:hypothetical protein
LSKSVACSQRKRVLLRVVVAQREFGKEFVHDHLHHGLPQSVLKRRSEIVTIILDLDVYTLHPRQTPRDFLE